jgi:hypothetical protein
VPREFAPVVAKTGKGFALPRTLAARGGNFDAMPLIAASAVILGHSLITTGAAQHPLACGRATGVAMEGC